MSKGFQADSCTEKIRVFGAVKLAAVRMSDKSDCAGFPLFFSQVSHWFFAVLDGSTILNANLEGAPSIFKAWDIFCGWNLNLKNTTSEKIAERKTLALKISVFEPGLWQRPSLARTWTNRSDREKAKTGSHQLSDSAH